MQHYPGFIGHLNQIFCMKWLLLLLMGIVAFEGCKRQNTKDKDPLIGKWELRYLDGGLIAHGAMFYPAGNGSTITFGDSIYEYHRLNRLVYHGTYTITRAYCYATGRDMNAFVIDNGKTFYEFSGDTLVLYMGVIAADGTITKYLPVH